MKLYRLENNNLEESPDTLMIDGNGILNPTGEQLKSVGYKTLEHGEYPILEWYETTEETYSEDIDTIYVDYVVIPKQNLQSEYMTIITDELNRKLENDFFWDNKCVKLSESNQNDYGNMYILLSNNREYIPSFQCNFKDNNPHFFADFDELNDFAISLTMFVNNKLIPFREETHKIKNYDNVQMYNYLKNKDIEIV